MAILATRDTPLGLVGGKENETRLPGAVPQPIGLFLFCIEFGWG